MDDGDFVVVKNIEQEMNLLVKNLIIKNIIKLDIQVELRKLLHKNFMKPGEVSET